MNKPTSISPSESKPKDTQTVSGNDLKKLKYEYKNFLEFVKDRQIKRAVLYAKALGIDRRTYNRWLQQPELKEAMIKSIDELVDGMEKAGSKDWKMYRELLSMMGVDSNEPKDSGDTYNLTQIINNNRQQYED